MCFICRYNNLNIDTILNSNRLVTNYVECLLSRKPCPPEGKDLKRKCYNSERFSASMAIDEFSSAMIKYISDYAALNCSVTITRFCLPLSQTDRKKSPLSTTNERRRALFAQSNVYLLDYYWICDVNGFQFNNKMANVAHIYRGPLSFFTGD